MNLIAATPATIHLGLQPQSVGLQTGVPASSLPIANIPAATNLSQPTILQTAVTLQATQSAATLTQGGPHKTCNPVLLSDGSRYPSGLSVQQHYPVSVGGKIYSFCKY